MGEVFSRPKAPQYIPPPEPKPVSDKEAVAEKQDEIKKNKAALFASRLDGRSQTIKTSLRGVLSETNSYASDRKNLLGG